MKLAFNASALKVAINNYRKGTKPDVEVVTSCQLEVKVIKIK